MAAHHPVNIVVLQYSYITSSCKNAACAWFVPVMQLAIWMHVALTGFAFAELL